MQPVVNHLTREFREETSGIANLNARANAQQRRDNTHWFEGFCDGSFWTAVALLAFLILTLIVSH